MDKFTSFVVSSFFIFAICLSPTAAQADFTPDIGARASLAGAQELLVSPPIPSLEGGRTTLTPQIGYMLAKVDGGETQTDPESGMTATLNYAGEVKGVSGSLGWSVPSSGRLSWFAMMGGDSLNGDIDVSIEGQHSGTIKGIQTQSFAFAAGPSYRFIGDANSSFAAGLFLGPAAIKVSSKFQTSLSGSDYSMEETVYGAYGGLQVKWRIGRLMLNPYVLYMHELSPSCKKMTLSDPVDNFYGLCPSDPSTANLVEMKSSFAGAGLYLGWNAVRFNVYSKAVNDPRFNDIKITNYSISYTFEN